jgi:hypothetical protein
MSNDLQIARVRVYAVTPRKTPRIRYHGRMEFQQLNAEIVRVTLHNGARARPRSSVDSKDVARV